jgi:hypothetical protein
MVTKVVVWSIAWSVILNFCSVVFADRRLEQDEIRAVLRQLVESRQTTWISYGTMNASHHEFRAARVFDNNAVEKQIASETEIYLKNKDKIELESRLQEMKLEAIPFNVRYKLSNEYVMDSKVTVKYDGSKFFWLIDVLSRTDSVKKPPELQGNFLTEEFGPKWNQKRIFCWDGKKYINYFLPGNHSIVTGVPSGVNGPLTAGLIPWGKGELTLEKLSSCQLEGFEKYISDRPELQITITGGPVTRTLTLDPEKQYAVKQFAATDANSMLLQSYENYQKAGQRWCPTKIIFEKYDLTKNSAKLLVQDVWDITIDEELPLSEEFRINYEMDALIEDFTLGSQPLQYNYSVPDLSELNVDDLVSKKLRIQDELQGL